MFEEELKKHDKVIGYIRQNIAAQSSIVQAMSERNAEYADARYTVENILKQREENLGQMVASYHAYEDLLHKTTKGLEFYDKLEGNVSKLLDRVKGVVKVQEEERNQILKTSEQKAAEARALSLSLISGEQKNNYFPVAPPPDTPENDQVTFGAPPSNINVVSQPSSGVAPSTGRPKLSDFLAGGYKPSSINTQQPSNLNIANHPAAASQQTVAEPNRRPKLSDYLKAKEQKNTNQDQLGIRPQPVGSSNPDPPSANNPQVQSSQQQQITQSGVQVSMPGVEAQHYQSQQFAHQQYIHYQEQQYGMQAHRPQVPVESSVKPASGPPSSSLTQMNYPQQKPVTNLERTSSKHASDSFNQPPQTASGMIPFNVQTSQQQFPFQGIPPSTQQGNSHIMQQKQGDAQQNFPQPKLPQEQQQQAGQQVIDPQGKPATQQPQQVFQLQQSGQLNASLQIHQQQMMMMLQQKGKNSVVPMPMPQQPNPQIMSQQPQATQTSGHNVHLTGQQLYSSQSQSLQHQTNPQFVSQSVDKNQTTQKLNDSTSGQQQNKQQQNQSMTNPYYQQYGYNYQQQIPPQYSFNSPHSNMLHQQIQQNLMKQQQYMAYGNPQNQQLHHWTHSPQHQQKQQYQQPNQPHQPYQQQQHQQQEPQEQHQQPHQPHQPYQQQQPQEKQQQQDQQPHQLHQPYQQQQHHQQQHQQLQPQQQPKFLTNQGTAQPTSSITHSQPTSNIIQSYTHSSQSNLQSDMNEKSIDPSSNLSLLSELSVSAPAPAVPMPGTIKKDSTPIQEITNTKPFVSDIPVAVVNETLAESVSTRFDSVPEELLNKKLQDVESKAFGMSSKDLEDEWKNVLAKFDTLQSKKESVSVARCYPFKNRAPDVLPFDFNRLVMRSSKDDYINASLICMPGSVQNTFVVTQTPMVKEKEEFWSLVWQEGTETVVCLATETELGQSSYLPAEKNTSIIEGGFTITVQSVQYVDGLIEKVVNLHNNTMKQTRAIIHVQISVGHFSKFLAQAAIKMISLRNQQRFPNKPVLVHCIDGGNKSGLLVAIGSLIKDYEILSNDWPKVNSTVAHLLTQRKGIFRDKTIVKNIYECLIEFLNIKLDKDNEEKHFVKEAFSVDAQDFVDASVASLKAELQPVIPPTDESDDDFIHAVVENVEPKNEVVSNFESLSQLGTDMSFIQTGKIPTDLTKLADLSLTEEKDKKKKFSKDDFNSPKKIGPQNDSSDPLSQLDPLWSLN